MSSNVLIFSQMHFALYICYEPLVYIYTRYDYLFVAATNKKICLIFFSKNRFMHPAFKFGINKN